MSSLNLRSAPGEGYWKPVLEDEPSVECSLPDDDPVHGTLITEQLPGNGQAQQRTDICQRCGTEFVVRSPYCRMCGWRAESSAVNKPETAGRLNFQLLCRKLDLNVAGLVCFLGGITCLIAAASVSFIFNANNLVDWQAVQLWRIEWLLAAMAAFLAGILLNRRS